MQGLYTKRAGEARARGVKQGLPSAAYPAWLTEHEEELDKKRESRIAFWQERFGQVVCMAAVARSTPWTATTSNSTMGFTVSEAHA